MSEEVKKKRGRPKKVDKEDTPKKQYYDINPILECDADFNLIYGQKGNGKTTGVLQWCLEQAWKKKELFAVLRRWQDDINGARCKSFFTEICSRGFVKELTNNAWTDIYYYQKCWYWAKYGKNGKLLHDSTPIAYARALTSYEHDNGNQYPDVYNIVFDEFLTRNEIPDEFVTFLKVYDNLRRRKDHFKVFLLGNTVSYFSTYWGNFGIERIHEQQPGEIDVYTATNEGVEVKIACEYCANIISSKEKATISLFENRNRKVAMITKGEWEIGEYPRPPKYKPCDVKFKFFIEYYEYTFMSEIVYDGPRFFMFIHPHTGEIKDRETSIIYNHEFHAEINYRRNILVLQDNLSKLVTSLIKQNRVFFSDNIVGNVWDSYIDWCKVN